MRDRFSIGIIGAAGRMGRAVQAQLTAADGLSLAFTADRGDTWGAADVLIDFSAPGSTAAHAARAAEAGAALVVGTTGLTDADHAALDAAGQTIAVVQAGNFSLGVNLLAALVEKAAAALDTGWDIEILETHHRHKVDAPSGTALLLGEAAAKGRGVALDDAAVRARDGITGERKAGEIGFASLRAGGVIGEHSVMLASTAERLTLSHHAEDRSLFANGALVAARFAAGAAPGRYDMRAVLGL